MSVDLKLGHAVFVPFTQMPALAAAAAAIKIEERPKESLRQLVNEIRQCSDEIYEVPGWSALVDRLNDIASRLEDRCT